MTRRGGPATKERRPAAFPTWRAVGLAIAADRCSGGRSWSDRTVTKRATAQRDPCKQRPSSAGLDALIDQFRRLACGAAARNHQANDLPGFDSLCRRAGATAPLSTFRRQAARRSHPSVKEQNCAAMLQYTLDCSHRVSIYVFNPRVVGTRPSKLHTKNMAASPYTWVRSRESIAPPPERSGVGYAIASDLGDDASAELALAAAPVRKASFDERDARLCADRTRGQAHCATGVRGRWRPICTAVVGAETQRLATVAQVLHDRIDTFSSDLDHGDASSVGVCTRGTATQSVTGSANHHAASSAW